MKKVSMYRISLGTLAFAALFPHATTVKMTGMRQEHLNRLKHCFY